MSEFVQRVTVAPSSSGGAPVASSSSYWEFNEKDAEIIAEHVLSEVDTKEEAYEECKDLLLLAAVRQDRTSMNGFLAAKRYMRRNGWNKGVK